MRTHLYKAIPENPQDRKRFIYEWATGSLIVRNKTTYCFKEDYDNDPDNTEYLIAYDEPTDWGLPNKHLGVKVIPDTICEAVDGLYGYEKAGDKEIKRQLFEGDRVNIRTVQYSFNDYIIKYSDEELMWTAVSQREREVRKDKFVTEILDVIRLDANWKYEYLGNIHDHFLE